MRLVRREAASESETASNRASVDGSPKQTTLARCGNSEDTAIVVSNFCELRDYSLWTDSRSCSDPSPRVLKSWGIPVEHVECIFEALSLRGYGILFIWMSC